MNEILEGLLRPILDLLGKIWDRLDRTPTVRWGTVTQTTPLLVQLDGDDTTLTPQTVVSTIAVGARVVCVEQYRRVIVLAVADA